MTSDRQKPHSKRFVASESRKYVQVKSEVERSDHDQSADRHE
jgi:hypothetical protein